MSDLRPTDSQLFFSRHDSDDPRLGEIAAAANTSLENMHTHLYGWPDDEGIRLNGGRSGASSAPDVIRKYLYKMTPPANTAHPLLPWKDRGNLAVDLPLLDRHNKAKEYIFSSQKAGVHTLSFGGGHDYGYADAAGFLLAHKENRNKPLVINIDAHLDVRPFQGIPHSGTPFRRLLSDFHEQFDFIEIGLQTHCNSRVHASWAKSMGAQIFWSHETEKALFSLDQFRERNLFVSLDIDAITSRSAPGCSQSWDTGLESSFVFEFLQKAQSLCAWKGLGIYEVSPPLDVDDRTAKLAAQFAFQFLCAQGE